MVTGLEKFTEYFADYGDRYVVIGGTAVQVRIKEEDLTIRPTKDIDIVLVVEAMDPAFVSAFWKFIEEGEYEVRHKTESEGRRYYRFRHPGAAGFPGELELFARMPGIDLSEGAHCTPLPMDEDGLTSLSAILMDDAYYSYTIEHSDLITGLRVARNETLICLKAKAFLEMTERNKQEFSVDASDIKKHKADIFRIGALLTAEQRFELPPVLLSDLQQFFDIIGNDLPPKIIYKNLGVPNLDSETVRIRIFEIFGLNNK